MSYQTKATGWTLTPARLSGARKAAAAHSAQADGRAEDYAWLREQGLTRRQAAERLGVSERTAFRYDRQLEAAS